MEKEQGFLERVQDYFQHNPNQFGWIMVALGIVLLIGSIQKWEWIFQGDGRIFNIAWFSEVFGPRAAKIAFMLFSLALITVGIFWVLFLKK